MHTTTILQSKKFVVAAIATAISITCIRAGLDVSEIAIITAPLYAYIGGQGLADFGKERPSEDSTAPNKAP